MSVTCSTGSCAARFRRRITSRPQSVLFHPPVLREKAMLLKPGESGLVALDLN